MRTGGKLKVKSKLSVIHIFITFDVRVASRNFSEDTAIEFHVDLLPGAAANRLAVKTCDDDCSDVIKVSPRDVTDHVMSSARRGHPDLQLCSSQPVDTAWSLLAVHGYRS